MIYRGWKIEQSIGELGFLGAHFIFTAKKEGSDILTGTSIGELRRKIHQYEEGQSASEALANVGS